MEPIPGGFPAAERTPNAGQVRITQTAIAKVTADPAGVLGPLAGGTSTNGIIDFPIPPSCGGTAICCPNGQPAATCGPIEIDLNQQAGDPARLAITPVQGASRVDVTVRARVKTKNPLPITYSGIDCTVSIDTTRDNTPPDLRIDMQLAFTMDPTAGTTVVTASNVAVSQVDSGDLQLSGGFLCILGDAFIGAFVGTLTDQISSQIQDTINESLCKACDSGNVAECGSSFATACTNNTCMIGTRCMQELGLDGRLRGSVLFSSLSPGTTGAMDLYEVAGGYATTNNNGIALGLLGGMLPGGSPRDKCGPSAAPPPAVSVPISNFFAGNTWQDGTTNRPFDVGIGLHKSQLADLAYAGYEGGLFCLTIGSSAFEQLSTDTIGLLSRSLGKLVESNSPMAVGLRPQSPPTITLGKNTFKDDGSGTMVVDVPLLDISFKALEIDFFASIDEQWVRVFTVVADVHLPIGLQTTSMGELAPVIGNPADAFTNISVKNNEAITESPEELAGLFPTLLSLVLPQLSGGLSPISLPALGGLALKVTAVTAVDNDSFLAIYADLVPAPMARQVDTRAEIVSVHEPADSVMRDLKRWHTDAPPSVTLDLAGSEPNLEYSYRIDRGAWSAWSTNTRPTLSPRVFWLAGLHRVEVRARQVGHPETLDLEPVVLEVAIGPQPVGRSNFHGQSGGSGCNCETGGGGSGALFALLIGLLLISRRALRRIAWHARRVGALVWLAALACLPGCSCGNPCGDVECLAGDVEHGGGGRWTSIAGDSDRVLVASYETFLGDLVVVDATDLAALKYIVVDGIPPDVKPTHDPNTYRGGVEDPGPNVGAWTSIAISEGRGAVAYQDRDEGALKYAYETDQDKWKSYTVDMGEGEIGAYASLVFDADKKPVIAYLAIGLDDNAGHRMTELRIRRGTSSRPENETEWSSAVIAKAAGACGGLCGGEQCVVGLAAGDPQECVVPSTGCTTTCADTEVCAGGACREKVNEPKVVTVPDGTGLYVSLVVLADGRLAATYYDKTRRALIIAVENAKNTGMFTETILDGNVVGSDRGMWTSAVVGGDGIVHVAYQDALGDQLMYTTWNNAPGTPELVDDGQRPGDRTHPVGAAGAIYLANGAPVILYQDGLTADVSTAARSGASWAVSTQKLPTLDGFSIGVTTGHGSPVAAWGQLDPAEAPPHKLVVSPPP